MGTKRKLPNRMETREIHHHHYNIISASENSVIIQGCIGNNIVGNGSINAGQLTEMETEMLRLFRSLNMRQKTEAMACLFRIEDQSKEVARIG